MYDLYAGSAIAAKIPMIATTIINSIRVKPFCTFLIDLFIMFLSSEFSISVVCSSKIQDATSALVQLLDPVQHFQLTQAFQRA
jgi:hypothetical protein